MLVCVYTIVVFDLNDVELQDFWIVVVGWDYVVECNTVVVNDTT